MVVPGYSTKVTLSWRAIVKAPTPCSPSACFFYMVAVDASRVRTMEPRNIPGMRVGRSVRYGMIGDIFRSGLRDIAAPAPPPPSPQPVDGWREVFASNGHPVIGDRPHLRWADRVHVGERRERERPVAARPTVCKVATICLRHPYGALERHRPSASRGSLSARRRCARARIAESSRASTSSDASEWRREMEEKLAAEEEEEAADGEEEDEDPPEVT